jgi:hypothetical protein
LRFSCSRSSMRSAMRDSASTRPSPASPMVCVSISAVVVNDIGLQNCWLRFQRAAAL